MTMLNKFRISVVLAAGAVMSGLPPAQTAPGDPVIAQRPLTQTARIKPAFIMAVDDSGSMNWEALFPNRDGTAYWGRDTGASPYSFYQDDGSIRSSGSGNYLELFPFPARGTKRRAIGAVPNMGFARSHEYNPGYFNPGEIYSPWANYDGMQSADATPGAARVHPATGVYFDLTTDVIQDASAYRFNFENGMVVPAGARYYKRGGGGNCTNLVAADPNGWNLLSADVVVTSNCDIAIQYFPATFYLTTATSPDGNTVPDPVVQIGGPRDGVGWKTLYRYEIKPGNYGSPAAYDAAMKNFANWFQYYRNRNLAVIGSMTHAFTGVDFMRVGYFTINNRITPTMRDMAINADRQAFYNDITSLPANNSTPNRHAVNHIGVQFMRDTNSSADPVQLACQVNAGMLFTDGYSNSGTVAVGNVDGGMGAPFADGFSNTIADIASKYYNTNLRPDLDPGRVGVPGGCSSPTPDPRLDCNRNLHMNFYGITLGALGKRYSNAPYIDNPNTTANEATEAAFVTPPAWFNDIDDQLEAVDAIWHATINTRGNFINAQSPSAVRDGMRDVLNQVLDGTLNSGSIAGSGSRVPGDSVSITVEPAFAVGNNGTDWTGELTGYNVNPDGTIGTTAWTASTLLPAHGSRNIIAGTSSFTASNLGVDNDAQLLTLGLTALEVSTLFPSATAATLVDYLRGDDSNEIVNGGEYRDRSSVLGDIVNSTPLIASGRDDYGWAVLDPTYTTFLATKATRPATVYVGANEGMLHAFDALTGVEQFAFIPNGVLGDMGELGGRYYPHRFYVDGDPVVTDAKIAGSWSTVLVGTTAAGGRSVFALNVDNPAGFSGSNVLWELTSASDGDLGNTFGRPVVVPLESGGFGAIFGNGYGNDSNDPFLYVVDMGTGTVLAKLAPNDGSTGYNGLGQIAVIDADNDGKADTVYGGDLQGNVWKFDISAMAPGSWNVAFGGNIPLFTATDAGGNPQAITGDLEVAAGTAGGVNILFGTGRYFAENDNLVPPMPQVQTLYGVTDIGSPAGTRTNLVQQQITAENIVTLPSGVVARSRQTTRNPPNFAKRGFYLDLGVDPGTGPVAIGEMFIGTPRIQNSKVFFTTFEPIGDPCTPGGRNWIYGLDLTSGGAALQNVQIDSSGTPACTGSCGALAIAEGAPVTETSIFIPRPPLLPGVTCDPADPSCVPPTLDDALQQCTLVIRAAGSPPLILPRPCGRQSWRQVR